MTEQPRDHSGASGLADESMAASCKEAGMQHGMPYDGNRCKVAIRNNRYSFRYAAIAA